MRKLGIVFLIAVGVAFFTIPFFFNFAGDAIVHMAIAEKFATGQPFHYNLGDPLVMASTSPFWTLLLMVFISLFGSFLTPIALKIIVVISWAFVTFLLYRVARDTFHWSSWQCTIMLVIWLTSSSIISNALSGMENILSAVQLLLIFLLCVGGVKRSTWRLSASLGLLLGWSLLTRADGGFFGAVCIFAFFMTKFMDPENHDRRKLFFQLFFVFFLGFLVVLPWYSYQYSLTGRLISDSAIARLYEGRRTSLVLFPDLLYFHPKTMITLGTVFLPLSVGFIYSLIEWGKRLFKDRKQFAQLLASTFPVGGSIGIVIVGVFFYSFIVGGEQFGRYTLPIMPFFFLIGLNGLWPLFRNLLNRNRILGIGSMGILIIFMLLGSGADYYRRVYLGENYSNNLYTVMVAPQNREQYTTSFLVMLGADPTQNVKIAVTEVQLRYFVDDRIDILSLDGRTSPLILKYTDKNTGIPDFEKYFIQTRPDFVQLGQWCSEGGWTAHFMPKKYGQNLLCVWERQSNSMNAGERFTWNDLTAIFIPIPPGIIRIEW